MTVSRAKVDAVRMFGESKIPKVRKPKTDTGRALKPPKSPTLTVVRLMIIAEAKSITLAPNEADVAGFNAYMDNYKKLLKVEERAIEVI